MGMSVGGSGGIRSEINVTPLIDVVLVLLIIFMVITPMLQMGYDVNTPPEVESALPPPTSDQILLRMDDQKRIYINKEIILPSEFKQRLEATMKNRESKMVFFAAAGELPFGDVAEFLDMCRNAGAQNLGIVFEEMTGTPAAASAVGVAPGQ
jgi:biopolymer transport protein ExbD